MPTILQLFKAPSGALIVNGSGAAPPAHPDDPYTITSIELDLHDGAVLKGQGEFKIKSLAIPSLLVQGTPPQLMSWNDIQKHIRDLRKSGAAADAALAAQIEVARDALRTALSNIEIDWSGGGAAFLGLTNTSLPLLANANYHCDANLVIDLTALDGPDDAVVLGAVITATGNFTALGAQATAAMRFELAATHKGLVELLPSLSFSLPKFPPLDLHWPKIDWPDLQWPSIDLSGLSRLLQFQLPVPGVGDPLSIVWQTKPVIAVQLAGTKLSIATTTHGVGTLCYADGSGQPQQVANITDFSLAVSQAGAVTMTGKITAAPAKTIPFPATVIENPPALPFQIEFASFTLNIQPIAAIDLSQLAAAPVPAVTATLDFPRILVRAKSDPSLLIAFHLAYQVKFDSVSGKSSGQLTALQIVEPYPVDLVIFAALNIIDAAEAAAAAAADAAEALYRLVSGIRLPKGNNAPPPEAPNVFGVLDRILDMMAAAARWIAQEALAAGEGLLSVAETLRDVLATLLHRLRDALLASTPDASGIAPPHLIIEVRLDARSHALRQIVIGPAIAATSATPKPWSDSALGVSYSIDFDWDPKLVIDLDDPISVALLAFPKQGKTPTVTLGTDLWLSRPSGVEAVRDTDSSGKRPDARLIQLTAAAQAVKQPVSLFRLSGTKAHVLEQVSAKFNAAQLTLPNLAGQTLGFSQISGPIRYQALDWSVLKTRIDVQQDRLLPFLQSPGQSTPDFLKSLGQYITVTGGSVDSVTSGQVELPITATLHIRDTDVAFALKLQVTLSDLSMRLSGGEQVLIKGKSKDSGFDLLGLAGNIFPKDYKFGGTLPPEYDFFMLDFSSGDVRLSLAPKSRLDLSYGKVASSGRGIVFRIDDFGLSRNGLDLAAKVDPDSPVQLAGVDTPFRFDSGGITIKNSEIQAFSIRGSGQLPPELVGEANVTIAIAMGRGADGSLVVQSGEAKLDKAGDPIVCHATRFTLTITALGLEFHDFSGEGAGYHFYFTLTGTATFTPQAGEFTDGLLKYLGSITITLDKAPLARDASLLMRAISFQVAVQPKKTFNFFNLFKFELRGVGFQPASPAFSGKPAMSISGQVNFVEAGDIVSPKFDFHQLWIAPPKPGDWLPQVRFDGLTLGIRFGGAASIEGMAIAVDDSLPSLYAPGALPSNVTARGFLAQGKLTIKGWGAMSAAMGFLELEGASKEIRQAFFLYAEEDELSIEIPTPVGTIYLREVGFGFGYRFTLAAFNRADQVSSVQQLVALLDDISKYQGNLASVKSWEPEADGNRLTLALRGMISITSASEEDEYNADGEKDLPNPVLFDIVAALRSDFTFFLNARVWVCRNYSDWHTASDNDSWTSNPTLRGYTYLSVPRKEFLARLVADGTGDVDGTHPKLPAPLVQAMKGIRWSATTYIRPGLFQQEFGWPYELGFTFQKSAGPASIQIDCTGGLINRIEDLSILYGIAFRAKGFAQLSGDIGDNSFGASVMARADFSLDAKLIAYVSLERIGDSIFYGSLAFDVTISLQVRIWLDFKAGFIHVHLEVGFSLSLTVSLALEAAAWVGEVAARGTASVAVGAFGRHIRLSIGLSINGGALDQARAQVARFLQLGLAEGTPDAEHGLAPPAAEMPRGPRAAAADNAVEQALDKHSAATQNDRPPPGAPPGAAPVAQGRPLQPSGYWAMLFPVAGDQSKAAGDQRYVMIFVPRDHSETGIDDETTLPTQGQNGELLGSFYAPPTAFDGTAVPSLCFSSNSNTVLPPIIQLLADGPKAGVTLGAAADVDVLYDVDSIALQSDNPATPAQGGADPADTRMTLGTLLGQCFVNPDGNPKNLTEPYATAIQADPERLPDSREAAAQVLAQAGRDKLVLGVEMKAANGIEERRSAIIASLCDSAATLAAGGEASWKVPAPAVGLDIRRLQLAFVVTGSQIDQLFPPKSDKPRAALFDLTVQNDSFFANSQMEDAALSPGTTVHLFNPPDRMFRTCAPRLAEPVVKALPHGISLDWELDPAFGPLTGVWNDPEFRLQHYRIERTVTDQLGTNALAAPMRTTVKAAGPLRLVRDPVTGNFKWRFVRPNAQFVDDLADLDQTMRDSILAGTAKLVLRYTIVPVDTAGTKGPATPLSYAVTPQSPLSPKAVSRVVLHFEYVDADPIKDVTGDTQVQPDLKIGLDDGNDNPGDSQYGQRTYDLRVRQEHAIATGIYGADAVTDALARPSAADFAVKQVTDSDFTLVFYPGKGDSVPSYDNAVPCQGTKLPGDCYVLSDKSNNAWVNFLSAIGVNRPSDVRLADGPLGVRFAVRNQVAAGDAPWCPADLTLLIDWPQPQQTTTSKGVQPAVAVPVEIFEHPVGVDAAPLMFEDLDGEAGRVLVLHPDQDGDLQALLDAAKNKGANRLKHLRDATRRVATRVRWNARPAASTKTGFDGKRSAAQLWRYFGGFDIFELDVAGEAEGATSAPTAMALQSRFNPSVAGGDPGAQQLAFNAAQQALASEIVVSVRDLAGQDRSLDLDGLNDAEDSIKGQIVLTKPGDLNSYLAFDLKLCVRANGYRRLIVATKDAGRPNLFAGASGKVPADTVTLVFTRDPPATPVARVQALPAAMALVDPPEIADFAKVEAHYPSETQQLVGPPAAGAPAPAENVQTSGRRGAWYSPAESFVVWPTRVPRRSLAINVDEPLLTELLSNGRPDTIAAQLQLNNNIMQVFVNSNPAPFIRESGWNVAAVRDLLQNMYWKSDDPTARTLFNTNPDVFHNAQVTIAACKDKGKTVLASVSWQIDLDPPLHPVLADVIDWARYEDMPSAYGTVALSTSNDPGPQKWITDNLSLGPVTVTCAVSTWDGATPPPALGFQRGPDVIFPGDAPSVTKNSNPSTVKFSLAPTDIKSVGPVTTADMVQTIVERISRLVLKIGGDARSLLPDTMKPVLTVTLAQDGRQKPPSQPFEIDLKVLKHAPAGARYRRYEPVLEPLPKVQATDVGGWLDETPEGRDPYGWSILRTLGLAAGLKLYDTEQHQYLNAEQALAQLNEAFTQILPRYAYAPLGAPFVDVIAHAGGTLSLASFDGGAPAVSPTEVHDFLNNETLALTQIALRPVADRFGSEWPTVVIDDRLTQEPIPKAVAYFAIRKGSAKGGNKNTSVDIDLSKLQGLKSDNALVADVIDLTTGLAKPPAVTLTSPAQGPGAGVQTLRDYLLDGAGEQAMLHIDVGKIKDAASTIKGTAAVQPVVALARIIVLHEDAANLFMGGDPVGRRAVPWVANGTVEEIAAPMASACEAFGRFPDLTARRFDALASPPISNAPDNAAPTVAGHPSVCAAVGQLQSYAVHRFPAGWPKDDASRALLVGRIPDWTNRFLDHGLASRPDNQAKLRTYFALAEVTRPDPWRVGINDDGTMEVLLTHDDRKRRLKRYAVRPFGRYDGFIEAFENAVNPNVASQPPQLAGTWSSPIGQAFAAQQAFEESWSRRFFDAVLPRTEPLAPPVLINAQRIEISDPPFDPNGKGTVRQEIEFIFGRHPEEILSEANVTVEGALSFEAVSFGFWREFPMQTWARDLKPGIDTLDAFGGWDNRPKALPALVQGPDRFGGLAQSATTGIAPESGRYPDGWRSALVARVADLPFFFRTHVAAFASAGVVVSNPVIATVEEGFYQLAPPWPIDTFAKPQWSVRLVGQGNDAGLWVIFEIPLVRLLDCMPAESRAMWIDEAKVKEVFTLPDPLSRYEIRVTSSDSAGLSAASPEIDVVALQGGPPALSPDGTQSPRTFSLYQVNKTGTFFAAARTVQANKLPDRHVTLAPNPTPWWRLDVQASIAAPAPPPAPTFSLQIMPVELVGKQTDPLLLFEIKPADFAAAAVWPTVVPTAAFLVTVNPTTATLKADVKKRHDDYALYPDNPAAVAVTAYLASWVTFTTTAPPPPRPALSLAVPNFAAGLPHLDTTAPAVTVTPAGITLIVTPTAATVKADVATWRNAVAAVNNNPAATDLANFLTTWATYLNTVPQPATAPPTMHTVINFGDPLPHPGGAPAVTSTLGVATWSWPLPANVGIVAREGVRGLLPRAVAAGYSPDRFQRDTATPIRAAMRRLSAARIDKASRFLGYPQLSTAIDDQDVAPLNPVDVAALAIRVAMAKDGTGSLLLPPSADVTAQTILKITCDAATLAKVKTLIAAIEALPGTAAVVTDLGALEDIDPPANPPIPEAQAFVYMPGRALADPAVQAALTTLNVTPLAPLPPVSWLLYCPPTDVERTQILAAVAAQPASADVAAKLATIIDTAIEAQVFGASREPKLKIYRGIATPIECDLVRAVGGPV